MVEFSFEIKEKLGTISASGKYSKELNIISYNGAEPKYDLRNWTTEEDGSKKMQKGLTLTKEEVLKLKELLATIN